MKEKIILVSKADLEITWFSGGGGAGGQHKNRHNNCCRIHHPASGATAQATDQRSAHQNQKNAFVNLTNSSKFKLWLAKVLMEVRTGMTVEERIERMMDPKNLKIEVLENGQWVEEKDGY